MGLGRKVQSPMGTEVRLQSATKGHSRIGPWSDGAGQSRFARWWWRIGLSNQFLLTAAVMSLVLFTFAGIVQNRWILRNIIQTSAETAAIYMEGIVVPHVQELRSSRELSAAARSDLGYALARSGLRDEMEAVKIWLPDGTIVYSTRRELTGRRFDSVEVGRAARGEVVLSYDDVDHEENVYEAASGKKLLEIYIPLHDEMGSVIAIGEFYQDIDQASTAALRVARGSWAIRIVFVTAGLVVLFTLVRYAHRTIDAQQMALRQNVRKARRLALQNLAFRKAADEYRRNAAKANENLLSNIGSEIHDGPIQLLSLAMLSGIDRPASNTLRPAGFEDDPQSASRLIARAIQELRDISNGLILPEIGGLSPEDAMHLAVTQHERSHGNSVTTEIGPLPAGISQVLKACMFRIVQECLNNSARYAAGKGQRVSVLHNDGVISITISDQGPGLRQGGGDDGRPRLGMLGVRNRVEAFGGTIRVDSADGVGTSVIVTLPSEEE